jgi:transposase
MSHANAKLNEFGRLLLVSRLEEGWTQAEVAEAQGISRSTVSKWWKRYREEGVAGLKDRSSAARRLPQPWERRWLRRSAHCGASWALVRIASPTS